MAREIYYQRQNMGGASIGMPAMPHVQSASTGASQAYAQVAKQGFDLGEKLLGAVIQIENQKQEALAEDAYLNARAEMARWKTQYMQQNQGVDAIEAQQAFERQWGVLSENIRKAYYPQISNNNIKVKLEGNLKLGQLENITSGYQYQDQQKKLWFKDLDDKALLDVDTNVSFDPYNSDFISADINRKVRAWEERYPGRDSTLYRQQLEDRAFSGMFNGRLLRGDTRGARGLLEGFGGFNGGVAAYEGLGGRVAQFESGNEGVLAIGYDSNGGTSYGLVQVSSRMGSMQEWGKDYLSKTEEGRKAWEHIKSAGPLNTGSRHGAAVDAYLEEARKNPELFAKTQRQYIREVHYEPMMKSLPEHIRKKIESKPALQEMAWSTAIQHGGTGGRFMLARAWRDGMTDDEYVDSVYRTRSGNFGSSTAGVQAAVKGRFGREEELIKSMLREGGQPQEPRKPMYVAYDKPEGLVEQGNIDIANRPQVKMEDGSTATVRSMSFEADGRQVLVPTVSDDGRILSEEEAIDQYKKTGKHLGKFDSVESANKYAQGLHEQQEQLYMAGSEQTNENAVNQNEGQAQSLYRGQPQGQSQAQYRGVSGGRFLRGVASRMDPAKAMTLYKAIESEEKKQRQNSFLNYFAGNPQAGIQALSTPEGRVQFGLDGKEAEEAANLLHTQWQHQKKAEKQMREDAERDVLTEAVNIGLGVGGKTPDPVTAYRMIAESNLDGKTKIEALKVLKEGTMDRDDPSYVIDLESRITSGDVPVTDAELARGVATGQLSFATKDKLIKLRDLANGPESEIIKSAFNAINDAYKKSMMADGTPEQAQAHYAALHELQMAINEAKEKGNIREILDPNSPKYILPGIMRRHQLSMQDQVNAIKRRLVIDLNEDGSVENVQVRNGESQPAQQESQKKSPVRNIATQQGAKGVEDFVNKYGSTFTGGK